MNFFSTILIVFTLLISGCSSSSSSDDSSDELLGMWVSACQLLDYSEQPYKLFIEFSENELTTGSTYYNDNDCIEESSEIDSTEQIFPYRRGQEFITANGNEAIELNVDFYIQDEFIYTIKDIVSLIDTQLYFGAHVSDDECIVYEQIEFGSAVLDVCNQRPTELNFEQFFIK